jgi:hypothetical protein
VEDKPNGVVIHICMETTQGNSLCSYLYLKPAKHYVSLFYLLCFSSTKLENRRVGQILQGWWWDGVDTSGRWPGKG